MNIGTQPMPANLARLLAQICFYYEWQVLQAKDKFKEDIDGTNFDTKF